MDVKTTEQTLIDGWLRAGIVVGSSMLLDSFGMKPKTNNAKLFTLMGFVVATEFTVDWMKKQNWWPNI